MATVRKFIKFGEPLSEEDKIRLRALRDRPVFIDDDCPELKPGEYEILEMKMPRPKRPAWDNKPPIVVYLNKPE